MSREDPTNLDFNYWTPGSHNYTGNTVTQVDMYIVQCTLYREYGKCLGTVGFVCVCV